MRIAVVRQRYNPYGGAERFVARALAALEKQGAQVTLVAREWKDGGAARTLKVDPFYVGRLWRDRGFARAACARLATAGFDLVQSHERLACCDIYRAGDGVHRQWLENRARAAGALARLADTLSPYHRYVLDAEAALFASPRLKAVICNSRMVRDEIVRGFRVAPEKLRVIYNGVDLEDFSPARRESLRDAARAGLGVQPRDTVFLFVGSGFARKGLDTAIDALAQASFRGFRLVVAGRDREAARFAARAERAGLGERVRFLGATEDVRPLYAAADCLILPTRYDPFPNTVLEALAMGLPAIVGRRCGAAEIIQPGVNGWVCEPDDAAGLGRLMHEADRALREGTIGTAPRSSAERFGLADMAEQLVALYRELAPQR
jgi:UDP-glucose:(heptosyl)LPS alpha-1,3-glucosyltransferase